MVNDLVLCNANIITIDPRRPRAEALAVRDGFIVAVGRWEEVERYAEGVRTLDRDCFSRVRRFYVQGKPSAS